MRKELSKIFENAAKLIEKRDYVRIISHYDADGITSAGIICNALLRRGTDFHAVLVGKLSDETFDNITRDDFLIVCDMGSTRYQLELISRHVLPSHALIIDHHVPIGVEEKSSFKDMHIINPYFFGIDGSRDVCTAGLAYLISSYLGDDMGKGNADLVGLAVAGAMGDKQELDGEINMEIIKEGVDNGVISVERDLKLGEGRIRDMLFLSTDPYIRNITGEEEKVEALLELLGIDRNCNTGEMSDHDKEKLVDALLSMSKNLERSALIGDVYKLHREVVKNSINFTRMIDASGRLGKTNEALKLCMRNASSVDECMNAYRRFQYRLISELKRVESSTVELENIRYFFVEEKKITGTICGIISSYIFTDKPVIVINSMEENETRISGRCPKSLLSDGIDLSYAMERAAGEVSGKGGGHPMASGAAIPKGEEKKFLLVLDKIVGEQKRRKLK